MLLPFYPPFPRIGGWVGGWEGELTKRGVDGGSDTLVVGGRRERVDVLAD